MKNKILSILILSSAVFFMSSCEDFLSTSSLSNDDLEYLASNPTDARKMLNHVYAYFCEDSYTSRMSNNWMQNTDVEFATINKTQALAHNDRRGIWCLNAGDFGDIPTAWNHNYEAIDFANQLIEGLEASEMYLQGDADMKQIRGEAYCLRAYRYFLLCNFWGDVPFATEPTSINNMNNLPRTNKYIIYSHIIQNLIDVEEDMKWSDNMANGVEWMNREFAIGFIAKLAMFRAGYSMDADGTMKRCQIDSEIEPVVYKDENGVEKTAQTSDDFYKVAQAYARKLIKLKDRALPTDFKNIFYTQINNASQPGGDVLYEIGFVQGGGGDVGWCIGLSVVGGSKGSGTTYTNMSPYYACSFDREDQRFPVTCAPYRYLTDNTQNAMGAMGISPAKWCRLDMNTKVESKNTGINWPILRYPDVLLLLAEANNEINNGPDAEAKAMLKRVRDRAFVNSPNKTEKVDNYINALNSYESFKKAIIDERAWEFGGECVRKFDLIRWNYYSDAIVNTIEWMIDAGANAQQMKLEGGEYIYDKNKEVEDKGVAGRLYFTFNNGMITFENDIFTLRNEKEEPYKSAQTIKDEDIKSGFTSENLYRVDFAKAFLSSSDKDAAGNAWGTDENGDAIKKGSVPENILYSWYGLTDGVLISGVNEDLSVLRNRPTPYVMPIPSSKIGTSEGLLSNDGYAIRNK